MQTLPCFSSALGCVGSACSAPFLCIHILKSRLVADIKYTSQTHGFMGHLWILWDLNKSSASSSLYHFIISLSYIGPLFFRIFNSNQASLSRWNPTLLMFFWTFSLALWDAQKCLSDRCLIQRPGSLEAIWCQRCRRSPTDRTPHRYLRTSWTNPEISKGFVASECL